MKFIRTEIAAIDTRCASMPSCAPLGNFISVFALNFHLLLPFHHVTTTGTIVIEVFERNYFLKNVRIRSYYQSFTIAIFYAFCGISFTTPHLHRRDV